MIYAVFFLGFLAVGGFLIGTFFGGRNPTATQPAPGAGVWASVLYTLDRYGDNLKDASVYVLIFLAATVACVQINVVLKLPAPALFLAVALIGLGSLVFLVSAEEPERKAEGIKTSKAITKAGLIALAVLILFLGFDGWVPNHLSVIAEKTSGTANEPMSLKHTVFWIAGIGGFLIAALWITAMVKHIFKKEAHAPTAATPAATTTPAAPAAPHHP